jgi:hypothetical protein
MPETLQSTVIRLITKLHETALEKNNSDKSNTGKVLANAFVWDTIAKYAKKQSELAWEQMEKDGIISYKGLLASTKYTLAESPSFFVTDNVSTPRKIFTPSVLIAALKKKYKVPEPIAKEMIEAAKVPGNSTHTCAIVER